MSSSSAARKRSGEKALTFIHVPEAIAFTEAAPRQSSS